MESLTCLPGGLKLITHLVHAPRQRGAPCLVLSRNCVTHGDQKCASSPRVRAIPLYDPSVYAQDQHSGKSQPSLQVVGYLGFFIDDVKAGEVTGYITPISGTFKKGGPVLNGGFAQVIMLVK